MSDALSTEAVGLLRRPGAEGRRRFAVLSVLAIAAVVALAVVSLVAIHRELTDSALQRRASVADLAASTLSEKFGRVVDLGVSLATRVRFRELIEAGEWTAAAEILRDAPADFGFVERIGLIDPQGALQAGVPPVPVPGRQNFAERDWFRTALEGKPALSPIFKRAAEPQINVFVAAVPIRSTKGGLLGVLTVQIAVDRFFAWVGAIDVGAGGLVYVVDPNGALAFHPTLQVQGQLVDFSSVPVVRALLAGRRGVERQFNPIEREERVSAYAPVPAYRWGVVVAEPAGAVFETRNALLAGALAAYLLIFGFSGAYVSSRMALQRARIEEERRRSAEAEDLFDNAPFGYHSVDSDGRIVRINQTWLDWLGFPREEVIGRSHAELMTPRSAEYFQRVAFPKFRSQGWLKDTEFEYRRKDGSTFFALLSATTIRDRDGRYVMSRSVVADITERKAAEGRIRALNAELETRAAQLELANKELESFSYSVSHDLRAPLRAVDGYALMLTEDYGERLDDEGRRLLSVVRASAEQMGRLIDDLLKFSQVGRRPLAKARLDMRALASEVLGELAQAYPKARVELGALPAAWGDRSLLRHVWSNLLGNALKYSAQKDAPRVEIEGRTEDGLAVYTVRDNGAGFDMRYYDKLFNVFQRLHREDEFEGTGVGLAIVQRVVVRHGGRVWGEGAPGEGARFHFSLPMEG
jgi:PAS domain S-box-containing protein